MSNDSQRADQIAFHLYTKLFSVVNQARTTNEPRTQPKLNRWFNLETPDSDLFTKEAREPFKSISLSPPPPLEIQVLLAIPDLSHTNLGLVFSSPDSSRIRIQPTPTFVLLETYKLEFTPNQHSSDVPLPSIYKAGIPLFRSLFTLLRILPVWKLHKRLRRRGGAGPSLSITLKVRMGDDPHILGWDSPGLPLETKTYTFTEVPHPLGTFVLSVQYLTTPAFQLDELESLLSSRFMSLDERPFIPTLAKNHHRDFSTSGLPHRDHSLDTQRRTHALSSSPPDPVSRSPPELTTTLADRFILPSPASSSSNPNSTPNSNPSTSNYGRTAIPPPTQARGIPLPLPERQYPPASNSLPRQSLATHSPAGSIPRQPLPSGSSRHPSLSRPSTGSGTHRPSFSSGHEHRPSPSGLEATRTMLRQEAAHYRTQSLSSSKSSSSPTNSFFAPGTGTSPYPATSITSNPHTTNTDSHTNLTLNTNVSVLPSSTSHTPSTTGTNANTPRRPVYPFPFKSNTLASSSTSVTGGLHSAGGLNFSGGGMGGGLGSQPSSFGERASLHDRMMERAPSSLGGERERALSILSGDRRSIDFATSAPAIGDENNQNQPQYPTPPTRKRYSSSFGHRYVSGGLPGSAGSGGSGGINIGVAVPGATGGEASGDKERSLSRSGSGSRSGAREGMRLQSGLGLGQQQQQSHSPLQSPSPLHPRSQSPLHTQQAHGEQPERRSSPHLFQAPPSPQHHGFHQPVERWPSPHPRSSSTSFMHGHTDDDDISLFVQDIDMRKPLVGRGRERRENGKGQREERERPRNSERSGNEGLEEMEKDERTRSKDERMGEDHSRGATVNSPPHRMGAAASSSAHSRVGLSPKGASTDSPRPDTFVGSPPPGMMLTSERDVDEKLKKMNAAFFKSLEGLGGGRRFSEDRRSVSPSHGTPRRSMGGEGEVFDDGMARRGSGHFRSTSGGGSSMGGAAYGKGRGEVPASPTAVRTDGSSPFTQRRESLLASTRNSRDRDRNDEDFFTTRNDSPFSIARNESTLRWNDSPYLTRRGDDDDVGVTSAHNNDDGTLGRSPFPRPRSPRPEASQRGRSEVIGKRELDHEGGGAIGGRGRREEGGH